MDRLRKILKFGNITSVGYGAGMAILLTLVFVYTLAISGLFSKITVSWWHLPASFFVSEIILLKSCTKKCFLLSTSVNVAVWIVALLIGWNLYDYSWDGNWYHQSTIFALADGWNPVWNQDGEELSLWSIHYAKALELISACIFKFTGNLESGKAVNILLGVASFLICNDCIRVLKPDISKYNRIILGILITGNPVWICQALTYYIDFAIYFYIVLTTVFSIELCVRHNVSLSCVGLSGVIILAVGTKFNHFFLEGITILAVWGWLMVSGKRIVAKSILILSFWSAFIGTVVFAFHPYITNWINDGTLMNG